MFSPQQFFGKHLLLILLGIALAGTISIATIPQINAPVTDYIGEKFGPKADIPGEIITPTTFENPYFRFEISSNKLVKGQKFIARATVKKGGIKRLSMAFPTND